MQDSDVTKQDTSWTPVTLTTNAQGTATITGNSKLPMGIYLVQEIDNPAVDIKAADCLVSLPLTNPAGDGWIYDVHIYPKNQLKPGPEIDKFITQLDNKDDTCDISQENKWIIETTMPDDMATCDVYQITDVLDTRLDFVSGSTELYRVDIHGNRVKMSTGGYTVNEPTTANGSKLTVTLNDTGKKEAAQSLQDIKKPSVYSLGQDNNVGTINIEFRTVLNKTAEGSMGQAIYNGASLDYTNNLHVKYDQVSVPDDKKPETHTTGINLVKVDSTNRNIALPGAKFKIYRSESDANKGINAIVDPTDLSLIHILEQEIDKIEQEGDGVTIHYKDVPANDIDFGLYTKEAMSDGKGGTIAADTLVSVKTVKKGQANTVENLPAGNYYLKELSTKDHLEDNNFRYEVTYAIQGNDPLVVVQANQGEAIKNYYVCLLYTSRCV